MKTTCGVFLALALFLWGASRSLPRPHPVSHGVPGVESVRDVVHQGDGTNDESIGDTLTGDASLGGVVEPWSPITTIVNAERPRNARSADVRRVLFEHDPRAIFEPHGTQVCASGCAVSRHPTPRLQRLEFDLLLQRYARQPMDDSSLALETLLFYGPQTQAMIVQAGLRGLDEERREFLLQELRREHAEVSIRVVDEQGVLRGWVDRVRVPLDRRHVFAMQTRDLPAFVTSGTVKRVGLDHLWTRL
ncbi:MAG: hypothetical protein KDA60_10945 [Planctomycetales bacterium]|nr:hypothetical protein [Planctomycetales bacterium]